MQLYTGCVENRQDPLKLGRCQVRVVGLHTHNKTILKTEDLPWAYPMQPVTSAGISGIGHAPVGPVEGTWVVVMFRDYPDNQQPVMLGTIGGIPQDKSVYVNGDKNDTQVLKNVETGAAVEMPSEPSDAAVITDPPSAATTEPTVVPTGNIPTTPPPSWKGDRAAAEIGIKALLAAADKAGLTTREQKCALLGIVGGECGWVPKEEDYSYSAERLAVIFPRTFKGQPELATQYARWKGSRKDFFNFVYAPQNNGALVGNTQADDGGKYYGKGFIQLTGRPNYKKYAQLSGVDILNNPDLLNTDINLSALVAAYFIKTVTKGAQPTDNAGYFYAAKKGVNPNDGLQPKLGYYEYFYGATAPGSDTTTKDASSSMAPYANDTAGSPSTYNNADLGFKDPNNKYPLKTFLYEPDTNRLARGISKGTIVPIKEAQRVLEVPKAVSTETWQQPTNSYGARYPYNHVFETESGHIQEFDDTPGKERIHTYHRKGTFTEIDENGSTIHRIVGDSYTIVDRNGCIYIVGEANLTVDGNINILCQSDANIEVAGDTKMKFGGNVDMGIAKDMTMAVGGNMSINVANALNINASTINETANSMDVLVDNYKESVGESSYRWNGDKHTYIGADTYNRHDSGIDYSCPADPSRSGSVNCSDVDGANAAAVVSNPPSDGEPLRKKLEYLVTEPGASEDAYLFETEEEWATPAGIARQAELTSKYGAPGEATDEATPTGGVQNNIVASCAVIYATEAFTNDFKLSKSFTLGMMIDGGVNGKNKLKAQVGLTVQQIVCNLSQLCNNVLEPLIDAGLLPGGAGGYNSQWTINSGYRSTSNSPSGGSSKSDHNFGRATDISLLPKDSTRNQRHFDLVQQIEKIVPYDQMILEYSQPNSCWIHIGYRGVKSGDTVGQGGVNRKMAFTMVNGDTYRKAGKSGFFLI